MPNKIRFGGGGRERLTLLWENSSPTSSFAAQTITLSDSLENYSRVRIVYKFSASDTLNENNYIEHCLDGGVISNLVYKTTNSGYMAIGRSNGYGALGARQFCFPSAGTYNQLKISNATHYAGSSSATDNSVLIPIYIYGVK